MLNAQRHFDVWGVNLDRVYEPASRDAVMAIAVPDAAVDQPPLWSPVG